MFLITYLRFMGFDVDNSMFEKHSWYFRNALVRANYSNRKTGVERDFTYLEKFLRNLLMGERHELRNRYLRIDEDPAAEQVTEQVTEQVQETLPETVALLVNGCRKVPTGRMIPGHLECIRYFTSKGLRVDKDELDKLVAGEVLFGDHYAPEPLRKVLQETHQ